MRIFVDMDGTLARFHDEVGYLERMFEKGFFSGLQPFQQAVQAINDLALYSKDCELFILSVSHLIAVMRKISGLTGIARK